VPYGTVASLKDNVVRFNYRFMLLLTVYDTHFVESYLLASTATSVCNQGESSIGCLTTVVVTRFICIISC
jgi:hypothetical protein